MENLTLHNITSAFPALMDKEELTEEEKQEIYTELTDLVQKKSQNIIGYFRNNDVTINAIKEEENRLAENRKTLENKQKRLKEYVKECMEKAGIKKIETPLGTISIAKSPISVEIVDEDKIPAEYKTIVQTIKVDKKAITDNFKSTGELIKGVVMHVDNTTIRIK